ncbi:MAG: phosphate transport system permease protein [Thermoproteota archaeon]|nr:phosphate transport system permease protein [Thermoproteota archaeon]
MSSLIEMFIEKLLLICATISVVVVILIFIFLFSQGVPALGKFSIIDFLFGGQWQPTSIIKPEFGALPMIWGTMIVTAIAMSISIPLGIIIAVYISEVADSREKEILKPFIELLAGIPSVVYGFFALVTLATIIQQLTGTNSRLNALNGGIILAIMAIPTIVSLAEDAITAVPREYREASLALGASKWETIRSVILPSSISGILGAILLGFGRVVGETMAVLMATGNAAIINFNILDSVRTLTATIAIETPEVAFGSLHYNMLFMLAILLFAITFTFNYIADLIMRRLRRTGR